MNHVLLAAAMAWSAPLGAQASAEAEVMAVVNGVFDAMRTRDSAKVRPLFHPKARLFAMDLRTDTARFDALEDFILAVGRARTEVFDERLSNVKVNIDGPLASVWADYTFHIGPRLSHCGVDHFLLIKEAGRWKIIELADTRRREGCQAGSTPP